MYKTHNKKKTLLCFFFVHIQKFKNAESINQSPKFAKKLKLLKRLMVSTGTIKCIFFLIRKKALKNKTCNNIWFGACANWSNGKMLQGLQWEKSLQEYKRIEGETQIK